MAEDPLKALEQDHRMVEQLFDQLAEAGEDEQATLVEQLREALVLHMSIEEEHLYPLVRDTVGDEEAAEAETEHELARTGLDQLTELTGQPGFDAALEMVKAGIEHHVQEEEGEIFPEAPQAGRGPTGGVGPDDGRSSRVQGHRVDAVARWAPRRLVTTLHRSARAICSNAPRMPG
jgi:iron-sulfur cluster repair protein YtfE (RIC family)